MNFDENEDSLPAMGYGTFYWTDEEGVRWFMPAGCAKDLPKDKYDKWVEQNPLPLFENKR